jgi:N-acetyl-gamma-glutamyl-phosphate reductase
MIEQYENPDHPEHKTAPFAGYGLSLSHKHVPEMQEYSKLANRPLFTPAYGRYKQGIVLYVPLHTRLLGAQSNAESIYSSLSRFYVDSEFVNVKSLEDAKAMTSIEPEILNGTNNVTIWVFGSKSDDQVLLAAVYDNLGKGASGAAVQNLDLMLQG